MRSEKLLIILFLLSSCGKNRQVNAVWPAHLVGFDSMSSVEQQSVVSSINDLNKRIGVEVIKTSISESQESLGLRFSKVEKTEQVGAQAGFAVTNEDSCRIDLSSFMFSSRKAFLNSVIWHELGHCAGLAHVLQSGEVMSKETSPAPSFSKESLERFISQFKNAAKL